MKILFTNSGPWGTGSFTALDSIITELMSRGHDVRVFFPEPPDMQHGDDDHSRPFELYRSWKFPIIDNDICLDTFPLIIPGAHPHNAEGSFTYKELSDAQFDLLMTNLSGELTKVIDDFQPDVIECNHIWAMSYVVSQLKHPYIVVAHNSDQMAFEYDERMRPYALQAAKRANSIVAITDKNKSDILHLYHVNEDKVYPIPNSYNSDVFKPMKVERKQVLEKLKLNIPDDAIIINLTGKITRIKGVDILLAANQLLSPHRNIHIIILGTGQLKDVISDDKLDDYCLDRVHLAGHVSPSMAAQVHNISRISVVPSRREGFPLSCIEAMGCGLPVVISELGGSEKIASGRIIPQENPAKLAQAIIEMIDLPEEQYQLLSQQALSTVKEYTWQKNVDHRLELYEKLLNS